ncbi:g11084 [Coccomyxa viridis]|uniref:G11084 protein n=1 Tax=Coccomyxa viridis TaxID=1274662 RepID=A0ABP1G8A0_9CHLO
MGDAAVAQANATVDIVHEIATILDTGLSKEEVAIIIALIENGVNPQALAEVVKQLKREAAALRAQHQAGQAQEASA